MIAIKIFLAFCYDKSKHAFIFILIKMYKTMLFFFYNLILIIGSTLFFCKFMSIL